MFDVRLLIGILQQREMVAPEKIMECLKAPAAARGKLLEVLIERGHLTEAQADEVRATAARMTGAQTPVPQVKAPARTTTPVPPAPARPAGTPEPPRVAAIPGAPARAGSPALDGPTRPTPRRDAVGPDASVKPSTLAQAQVPARSTAGALEAPTPATPRRETQLEQQERIRREIDQSVELKPLELEERPEVSAARAAVRRNHSEDLTDVVEGPGSGPPAIAGPPPIAVASWNEPSPEADRSGATRGAPAGVQPSPDPDRSAVASGASATPAGAQPSPSADRSGGMRGAPAGAQPSPSAARSGGMRGAPAGAQPSPVADRSVLVARAAEAQSAADRTEAVARGAAAVPVGAQPSPSADRSVPAAGVGAAIDPVLERLLRQAAQRGASDIHFHAGMAPLWRVDGRLTPIPGEQPIAAAVTERMAHAALAAEEREHFVRTNDADFALTLPGVARCRANAYREQRGIDLVLRLVPLEVPSLRSLGLPEYLTTFTKFHQGLILCTGPAGCGKSTTMAALLDIINRDRAEHILTIEDPIEFVHRPIRSLVRQRQVRRHTESFARALRAALREDPDVIGVGELRDLETVRLALSAAETGHLVLATLHTNSAIRTINRVLNVFPPEQQPQVRVMFASSVRAIISQKLVLRADGSGRVPALEVLTAPPAVVNLIRDEKQHQLRSVMQTGRAHGMRLLEDSLKELVAGNIISAAEARSHGDAEAKG